KVRQDIKTCSITGIIRRQNMRAIILTLTILGTIGNVSAKTEVLKSDLALRECLAKVYNDTSSSQKDINAKAKVCRETVREMKKSERAQIKKKKLLERIAKANEELKKL